MSNENREKVKRWVEINNGTYEAPDGMGQPTNVGTAHFKQEEYAHIFIEEMGNKGVPCNSNFLDFDDIHIYFQENRLGHILIH